MQKGMFLSSAFLILLVQSKIRKRDDFRSRRISQCFRLLRGCRKIKKFMLDKEFFAPVLASYANSMTEYKSIEEEINFSIKGNSIDANK